MVYNPGICIVAQGHKIGYLAGRKFRDDANHYLVTSVTTPFECETFASPEEPLRGLYIDIDVASLAWSLHLSGEIVASKGGKTP